MVRHVAPRDARARLASPGERPCRRRRARRRRPRPRASAPFPERRAARAGEPSRTNSASSAARPASGDPADATRRLRVDARRAQHHQERHQRHQRHGARRRRRHRDPRDALCARRVGCGSTRRVRPGKRDRSDVFDSVSISTVRPRNSPSRESNDFRPSRETYGTRQRARAPPAVP